MPVQPVANEKVATASIAKSKDLRFITSPGHYRRKGADLAMKCCRTLGEVGLLMVAVAMGCSEPDEEIANYVRGKAKAVAVHLADKRLLAARAKFKAAAKVDGSAWRLGSACFQRAEFLEDNEERKALAKEGIAACRRLIDDQPNSIAGHYYLGLNLGQLARVKNKLLAWGMVDDIERALEKARDLDARFCYAGPDRSLGLLHYNKNIEASILYGKDKARMHLKRAVELAPDYPANRLNLLEAYVTWKDVAGINAQRAALRKLLPKARKEFTGPEWAWDWVVWDTHWGKLREKPRNE